MKLIGLLSDTHDHLDDRILEHFKECDEIWHAGDIGTTSISDKLTLLKPFKAVYGNIDGHELRIQFPEVLSFEAEGVKVLMIHIGGYPGRYSLHVKDLLLIHRPDLFICGHSHILKVMRDKQHGNMLYMNPGAAGHHGFHKIRTMLRFKVDQGNISDLELIELGKRGSLS